MVYHFYKKYESSPKIELDCSRTCLTYAYKKKISKSMILIHGGSRKRLACQVHVVVMCPFISKLDENG